MQVAVMTSSQVQQALVEYQKLNNTSITASKRKAMAILRGMAARPQAPIVRALGGVLTTLVSKMYRGVFVNANGLELVRHRISPRCSEWRLNHLGIFCRYDP